MRIKELAQSQEDAPVEELADDLHDLLNLLGRQRRWGELLLRRLYSEPCCLEPRWVRNSVLSPSPQ
ncbi:MAG TPA: hypothetical protein VFA32_14135 [Dehalococcoidia bacterium]|nr:hypothetical protein [Dehalococcoidia bacterium]